MGLYVFSSGVVVARVLRNGILQSKQIPTLQEASIKYDATNKTMHGNKAYAEDAAGGSRKITGSLKFGKVSLGVLNDIFFNGTVTTGHVIVVPNLGGTVGLTPVSDDVNVGHVNITDMGVISAIDGFPLTRVATVAANGEYEVAEATGIYTFFAADPRAARVRPTFRYTDSASGRTVEMGNPDLGTLADMELTLWKPRFTKNLGIILYHAVPTSLDLPGKREEYTEPAMNFECFVDDVLDSPGQLFSSDPD